MDKYIVRRCPKCNGIVYRYFSLYEGWHEGSFHCGFKMEDKNESRVSEHTAKGNSDQAGGSSLKQPICTA
jgi:hypothetical protein